MRAEIEQPIEALGFRVSYAGQGTGEGWSLFFLTICSEAYFCEGFGVTSSTCLDACDTGQKQQQQQLVLDGASGRPCGGRVRQACQRSMDCPAGGDLVFV
jgi:hypothetical protein